MKLTYFDLAGRAEPVRLAFVIGGIDFDDERIQFSEWPSLKPTTPFGTLPILENHGAVVGQSHSILRYVGRQAGLYPTDDYWAAARVDDILNFVSEEVMGPIIATVKMSDPEKTQKRADIVGGPLLDKLAQLDTLIGKNGTGYCVGESLTIADLEVYSIVITTKAGFFDGLPTTVCDPYTNVMECHRKVETHPAVAAKKATLGEN